MKKKSGYSWLISRIRTGSFSFLQLIIAAALFFSFAKDGAAQVYDRIELYPPHVGVFAAMGEQQFIAYGVTAAGLKVNITDKVDWYLKEYPFKAQTLKPYEVATIDEDGLLTINENVTWGRVSVTACYPKGCGAGLVNYAGKGAHLPTLRLLLVPSQTRSPETDTVQ